MTISDLLDDGIQIQGEVTIRKWDEITEKYSTHSTFDDVSQITDKYLDERITHMYSIKGIGMVLETADNKNI